jgi:methionine salvage enolase-phosphatase E1
LNLQGEYRQGRRRQEVSAVAAKSVAQKLQVKQGTTVWASGASGSELIGPLPDDARQVDRIDQAATAVVFASSSGELRELLDAHKDQLSAPSVLWIAYPKGNRADINRESLWPILGEYGMRPISQISIDEVWSALRFRPLAEGETFHPGR